MSSSLSEISTSNATPKYRRIAEEIRRQMQTGVLQPGDRLPSLAEMRAEHGVTPTTVERIYSVLREDGLIVREQGRGTFVAQPATRPATGVIGIAGVTFDLQRYPYWSELMEGIRIETEEQGYEILLLGEASPIRWEKVDGVLLCGDFGPESMDRLPFGMPHVVALAKIEDATCVIADEAQGVRQAINHLVELGHQRIGYLVTERSRHRLAAYQSALTESGIAAHEEWTRVIPGHGSVQILDFRQAAYDITKEWLGATSNELGITALLTQNDEAAIGAIEALCDSGIRTPEEISVVGFDGTVVGDYFSPRLTSVNLPLKTIGITAAQHLFRAIEQEASPITITLPTSLKLGFSTSAPVVAKPSSTESLRS